MGHEQNGEHDTIRVMVGMYCEEHHHDILCESCAELLDYALERNRKCPYGEHKPACSACPVHCYKPEMRSRMQEVMRYAGPRLARKYPALLLQHLRRRKPAAK